ncbi:MAG TPA: hypothetical protein VE870_17015 [Bacteroidales bacterium]|nr:hypothetical protein [Bacteroidales bacterium]
MKRNFLLVLSTLLLTVPVFSQADDKPSSVLSIQDDISGLALGTSYNHAFDNRYEGVEGTPFMNKDWENGGIYLLSGKFYNNLKLKLDAYNNNLIFQTNDGKDILLDKSLLDYFILTNNDGTELRKFKVVRTPENPLGHYYQVLYDKDISLLLKYEKVYVKADYQKAINTNRRYDEFKTNKIWYIYKPGDQEPQKIKLNKREAKELFSGRSDVSNFISKNNLNMKSPEDWVELLTFISSN